MINLLNVSQPMHTVIVVGVIALCAILLVGIVLFAYFEKKKEKSTPKKEIIEETAEISEEIPEELPAENIQDMNEEYTAPEITVIDTELENEEPEVEVQSEVTPEDETVVFVKNKNLEEMTRAELLEECKKRGFTGISRLKKQELLEKLK